MLMQSPALMYLLINDILFILAWVINTVFSRGKQNETGFVGNVGRFFVLFSGYGSG